MYIHVYMDGHPNAYNSKKLRQPRTPTLHCATRYQSGLQVGQERRANLSLLCCLLCGQYPNMARFWETTLLTSTFTIVPPGRVCVMTSLLHSESLPHPITWAKFIRSLSSLPQGWFSPRRPHAKKLQLSHHIGEPPSSYAWITAGGLGAS